MSDVAKVRTEFIETVGMITKGEGLPRIAGRVLGLLIFDGAELTFGQIAETLKVSRGSISSSVRLLEDRGLIKRAARLGQRQDYFMLADDPYTKLLERTRAQTDAARREIEAIARRTPAHAEGARDRVTAFAAFYGLIGHVLTRALDETRRPMKIPEGKTSDE